MGLKEVGIRLIAAGESSFLAAISASEKAIARFGDAGEEVSRDLGKMGRSAAVAAASTEILDKATGAAGRAADNLADQLSDVNRELGQLGRGALAAAGSLAAFSAASGAGALSKTAGSLGAITTSMLGVGTASAAAAGKLALVGTVVGGIGVAGFAAGAGAVAASILAVQAAAVTGAGAVLAFGVAFNALDEAAPIKKELDETTKALENMKEKGINSGWEFDQLNTKLQGLQAEYDATFMGMVGTIAKFGREASKEISKPIFDGLKVGLSGVVKLIQSPAVQNAVPRLAGIVEKAVSRMTASFKKVIPAINWDTAINSRLDALAAKVEAFTTAFDRALPKLIAWGGALKTLGSALGGPVMIGLKLFVKGLTDIDTAGAGFEAGVGRVANVMEFLGRVMAAASTIVSNLVGGLITGLGPTLERLNKAFEGVVGGAGGFDKVLANIGEVVGRIGQSLGGFIGALLELGVTVVDLLGKIGFFDAVVIVFDRARDAVLTFASALRGDWIDAGSEKIAFLDRVFGILGLTIRDLATAFGNFFSGNFDAGFDALGSAVGRVAGFILEAIPNIIAGLGKILASIIQYVVSKAPEILAQLGTWAKQFWAWIEPQIPTIIAEIGKISAAIITWITTVALPAIAGKVLEWAGAFLGWVQNEVIPKLPETLKAIWDGLSSWIGGIAGSIGEAIKPWTNAIVAEVSGWAAAVGLPLAEWQAKFQGSLAKIGEFFTGPTMDDWKTRFQGSLAAIGETITPVLDDWKTRFQGSLQAIGENFTPTLNDWKTRFQGSLEAIGKFFSDLFDGIKNAVNEVLKVFGTFIDAVMRTGQALAAAATGDFERAYKLMSGEADKMSKDTAASMSDLVSKVADAGSDIGGFTDKMADSFMDASDRTKTSIDTTQKNVDTGIAGIGNVLTKFTTAPFNTEIGKMPGQAGTAVDATKAKISGADFSSVLLSAGSAVVDGLIAGINNNAGRARAAAANLGASVAGGAGQALQSQSPSKVFEELGKFVAMGLAIGIKENSDLAVNAAAGMAEDVGQASIKSLSEQADVLSKIAGAVGNLVDALSKMRGFSTAGKENIAAFNKDALDLTAGLYNTSTYFSEEMMKVTGMFADTLGKVGQGVGAAFSILKELPGRVSVGEAAIYDFGQDLFRLVANIYNVSTYFSEEMTKAIGVFGEANGKLFGGLKDAVSLFELLRPYTSVPSQAMQAFVSDIELTVSLASALAVKTGTELLAQVAAFGTSIGQLFTGLKSPMDVFKGMRDEAFKNQPSLTMQAFIDEIGLTVTLAADMANRTGTDLLSKATAFAEAVDKIFSKLKSALDIFKSLEGLKDNPAGALDKVLEGIGAAIQRMAELNSQAAVYLSGAQSFADTMRQANQLIADGLAGVAGAGAGVGGVPGVPATVPGMADGGTADRSGLFKVGERGPELLWLPKGASVMDAITSARVMESLAGNLAPMSSPPASASQIYNQQQVYNQQQASQVIYDQRQSNFNQTNHNLTPDAAQDYYIARTMAGF